MTFSHFEFLAQGIGLGATIAFSVGPMKVLCLRRAAALGGGAGIVTAAGVVTGDAIYVAIAALGLTAVTDALQAATPILRIIGGLALLYLAVGAWRRRVPTAETQIEKSRYLPMYLGTVGLTLTNPITVVMFATVLLGGGGLEAFGRAGGHLVPPGMVLGSALVWAVFAGAAILAGRKFTPARLVWLNRAAAVLFLYFGVDALLKGVRMLA